MIRYWKKMGLILLAVLFAVLIVLISEELLTLEALKKNSQAVAGFVNEHYVIAVFALGAAFVSTAFFLPGAVILTVSGGFFFGAVAGGLYASVFSTAGCTLAFLASRHLIGAWVQQRYHKKLKRFNREIERHGANYLFALRVLPVMPSFLVNYLSGLTVLSPDRFALVTFFGICPGAFVYAFAGGQLKTIEQPKDILSPNVLLAFLILALFALLPVVYDLVRHARARRK